jgi:hypothetical protein
VELLHKIAAADAAPQPQAQAAQPKKAARGSKKK